MNDKAKDNIYNELRGQCPINKTETHAISGALQ